ncbi:MAG: DNA-processing protein DprA [Phycisphaerales bacterium]
MVDDALRDLLRLTLTPGLGPILIGRLLAQFGSPDRVLAASAKQLEQVRGIGAGISAKAVQGIKESAGLVDDELALAAKLGVRFVPRGDPAYPPLLATITDAPPLLYVRGSLRPAEADRYPVAIVGSRRCSAYGVEQAERFAGVLAGAGLTIVSGGARGIDSAAHRGAMRVNGRTIAVLGCGLGECYPPENADLFERIAAPRAEGEPGGGALVSELPLRTMPESDNFPARNRLISGISLGIVVIEAGARSGALITARLAAEEHNREVMAVPGRIDSEASAGSLELIKQGGAALITDPGDVLHLLETPARHSFVGTHESRYADPTRPGTEPEVGSAVLFEGRSTRTHTGSRGETTGPPLSDVQRTILSVMDEPMTLDQLAQASGVEPARLRAELTLLEIQRRVARRGSRLERAARLPRN